MNELAEREARVMDNSLQLASFNYTVHLSDTRPIIRIRKRNKINRQPDRLE